MEWCVWITSLFLFCLRNSRLYGTWHSKAHHINRNSSFWWLHCENNGLVFKIKDGFKLELQMPEITQLFDSARKLIDQRKNEAKVVEVVFS